MPSLRRPIVILITLFALASAHGQSLAWQTGIAKITLRANLNRKPATAFVVAVENGKAWLVTSAHVIEGDANPQVEFVASPGEQYKSTVNHLEAGDKHGLALLEVPNAPATVVALQAAARPAIGQNVTVAGFPASLGNFTVLQTIVATYDGRELVLGLETEEGFSGGPVLSESGAVAGLVFGNKPRYGLAVQSSDIRTYLEGRDLSWGAQTPAAAPTAGDIRINPADGLKYVFIPPGSFLMGCSPGDHECWDDERPARTDQFATGFWLGQTEVTQAAWKKVNAGANPSHFQGDQLPVESVTWHEATAYCRAIGGHLPTEKEWEYATRAGSTGASYGPPDAIAWYKANSGDVTHPVGLKQPNSWGLYDMLGNVLEWTADAFDRNNQTARGGGWISTDRVLRASMRVPGDAGQRQAFTGLRCVADFRPSK